MNKSPETRQNHFCKNTERVTEKERLTLNHLWRIHNKTTAQKTQELAV